MNAPQYFLDASFVVSFIDSSDRNHGKAVALHQQIKGAPHEIFVSDVLLNETLTGLGRRSERRRRSEDYRSLSHKLKEFVRGVPVFCLYEILNRNYGRIAGLMEESAGLLSFHDCLIVFFLKEVPDVTLVTFDRDFDRVKGLKILSAD